MGQKDLDRISDAGAKPAKPEPPTAEPGQLKAPTPFARQAKPPEIVSFDRKELSIILNVYGRRVADGEWRDYAIDFSTQNAVFSIFRRTAEIPLFKIEKNPALARKQGAYSVIGSGGVILKRGHDLEKVVDVLRSKPKLTLI